MGRGRPRHRVRDLDAIRRRRRGRPDPVQILAVIAVIFAARLAVSENHDGWAFTASAIAIAATVGSIFINLYPNVMISSTNPPTT